MESEASFARARPRLFGIAYRMLGSAAEAEDVVQDVWLRWRSIDPATIRDPGAFLATATTRLAINVLQSARARRETYVGPWLPEPLDTRGDPELGAARGEALALAVLVLLEKLPPAERAAYVLREAFDYPYAPIADILQTTEANARQLVTRAKKHLAAERRATASAAEHRRLLDAFLEAAQRGEPEALEALLAERAVSYTDGNGVAKAARAPVAGRARVARFVASFAAHFWPGTSLEPIEANGQPATLVWRDGTVLAFVTVDASAAGIEQLLWVMSPAKLARFTRKDAR